VLKREEKRKNLRKGSHRPAKPFATDLGKPKLFTFPKIALLSDAHMAPPAGMN
jgi:hypothetical protein